MRSKPSKALAHRCSPLPNMVITILGCGTSIGVPMIGREMPHHKDPKNRRLRASILIEPFGRGEGSILIDTSPDLRQQALTYFHKKKTRLDAVLITHEHADHLHGIDDIRPFNFLQRYQIPFYGEKRVMDTIHSRFHYIFYPTQIGGGLPQLSLNPVGKRTFRLKEAHDPKLHKVEVTPLPCEHGKITCYGYRIGSLAYITDISRIPEETMRRLKDLDVLILDCLRPKPHPTHINVEQAIDYAQQIKAKKIIFTHMNQEIEYDSFRKSLPPRMVPAFDGMRFNLPCPVAQD